MICKFFSSNSSRSFQTFLHVLHGLIRTSVVNENAELTDVHTYLKLAGCFVGRVLSHNLRIYSNIIGRGNRIELELIREDVFVFIWVRLVASKTDLFFRNDRLDAQPK